MRGTREKLMVEGNFLPLLALVNEELLEAIYGDHERTLGEKSADDLVSALKKNAGTQAPLSDLTENLDMVHAETTINLEVQ